jgi:3-phosphoshikimate 1-carboxyvinyltransferase
MTRVSGRERLVRRAASLSGVLHMPSDKSIGHRALIANAVADGSASVELVAPGADLLSTIHCLEQMGVEVRTAESPGTMSVQIGGSAELPAGDHRLDCGNSGTTMRLLAGLTARRTGTTTLDGDPSLRLRPMERVAKPLRAMGAAVRTSPGGTAPLTVHGRRPLRGMRHRLPVASAQVLGAVLLAGLAAEGETEVELPAPVRDHTERLLGSMGADVHRSDDGLRVSLRPPGRLVAQSVVVPGDPSSAAAWMVAAAVSPGTTLRIAGLSLNPTRLALVDLLRQMGASLTVEPADHAGGPEPVGDIVVRGEAELRPVQLDGSRTTGLIDELPLVAIAMAAAEVPSELRDAAELRVKESDRIAAIVAGLDAIGAQVRELPDGWQVSRGRAQEARIATHGDHRIAIAFAIAASTGVAGDVLLDDGECVAVSYPTFWDDLRLVSQAAEVTA